MTVSAPVSLSKVRYEFGGTTSLSSYVRGGTYVADTTPNAAVSNTVSGLKLSQFLNTTAWSCVPSVLLSNTGTTATARATWSGGTALESYTYNWTYSSVSGYNAVTINAPTSSNTSFSGSTAGVGCQGTATCTVRGTTSGLVSSIPCSVTIQKLN